MISIYIYILYPYPHTLRYSVVYGCHGCHDPTWDSWGILCRKTPRRPAQWFPAPTTALPPVPGAPGAGGATETLWGDGKPRRDGLVNQGIFLQPFFWWYVSMKCHVDDRYWYRWYRYLRGLFFLIYLSRGASVEVFLWVFATQKPNFPFNHFLGDICPEMKCLDDRYWYRLYRHQANLWMFSCDITRDLFMGA
jgi:hypothetical protein